MGDAAISFGDIVGRLSVIVGIEFVHVNAVTVLFTVLIDQFIEVIYDVFIGNGFAFGQAVHEPFGHEVFLIAFHRIADVTGFIIILHCLEGCFNLGAGSDLLLIGGGISDQAVLAGIAVHDGSPLGLCFSFDRGNLLIRELVQAVFGRFLMKQGVLNRNMQTVLTE